MRKMKILVIITLLLILPVNTLATGEGTTSVNVDYSVKDVNIVSVTGKAENVPKNTEISITIIKNGKSLSDTLGEGKSDIEVMAAIGKVKLDSEYNWIFEWQPTESGNYDIYAASKYFAEPVKATVYITANRANIIQTVLTGTKDELKELFSDENNIKAFITKSEIYEGIKDISRVGEQLYIIRDEFDTNEEVLNSLPLCCKLVRLGEKPSPELLDEIAVELSERNRTLTNNEVYGENASKAIKTAMAAKLAGVVPESIEDFDDDFTEALILCGIAKTTNYVSAAPFLDLLGNKTYEANKDTVLQAVVGNSYTMEKLIEAIENSVQKKTGSGGGGGGTSSRVTFAPVVPENPSPQREENKTGLLTFTDVPDTHWAFEAINNLRWKDIVSGNENGEFLPDSRVTRAEAVKMLCGLYGIEGSDIAVFEDVDASHWGYKYIGAAYEKQFIMGDGNRFNPDGYITRQDFAAIIYRVSKYYEAVYGESIMPFGDAKDIAYYASEAVGKLTYLGIINGKDNGNFEPTAFSTRAEAAAIIYRLLKLSDKWEGVQA